MNAFPSFCYINGKYVSLKNIAKKYSSLDEFFFAYSTAIGHNEEKHKEVLEILN